MLNSYLAHTNLKILRKVRKAASFRNSGKKTSFFSTESIKIYGASNAATQIEEGTHATMLVTKNGKRFL